jgi:hypothetical protein
VNARHSFFVLPLALCLAGCHGHSLPTPAGEQALAEKRAQQNALLNSERDQLNQIPPPAKSRFMAIRSTESWENPSITVQPDMLTLHVLLADPIPQAGSGGMLRPIGARKQDLNISLDKLGEAVTAIPTGSWPYGRVIAVEEAHKTPEAGLPAVRRNMEAAVRMLNDLGVVAYDLNEGNLR